MGNVDNKQNTLTKKYLKKLKKNNPTEITQKIRYKQNKAQ